MINKYKNYKKVGSIDKDIADKVGFKFYGNVYASPGVLKHIIKKHGKQLTRNIKDNLKVIIERIIINPDFIGMNKRNSKEGSLELVKKIDAYIMLVLAVDIDKKYIYVSSMYPVTKSKMKNKIYSGSLKEAV
ncbi:hypothetical protein J2Z53_000154 [Clostridium moniliforme]|uniref:Phage-Barnase-EndoU-ColicinE5/D-RelE like nuclease 3 domain-containing protein n=1 Tax=Clostridium moniliforme TaxID=39489 RepID=A0ABS4EX55_9CLOT|nr:PBECR2 nuclease fold domain-containing protein [Clostridium moniliforme]MBP1888575.1 hypothetical protein [Clostridium moniliforme]